jgi:RimJ/RimL family protein N-acetyltransferase
MKVLETKRLILRRFRPEDFDELYRMNSDPAIMKYVGNGSTRNHMQIVKELDMLISHYVRKPGLGIWATLLKDSNIFVGASGLVYFDNTEEIEIGYRMLKEYWCQGYATEASVGLLNYGFETLGLKKIVSSAHPENMASRRVMEKIGMSYIDSRFQYDCMQAYYEITAEEYVKVIFND